MRKNKVITCLQLIGSLFIMIVLHSCVQNSVCLEPQTISMRGGFYYNDTSNKHVDTALVNANMFFGDSLNYFYKVKKLSKFSFPLSQINDHVQLIFQSDSASVASNTIDTIELYYTRDLTFISVACGYRTNYNLDSAITTRNVIDSVLIGTPKITNEVNKEHLQIVLKK